MSDQPKPYDQKTLTDEDFDWMLKHGGPFARPRVERAKEPDRHPTLAAVAAWKASKP